MGNVDWNGIAQAANGLISTTVGAISNKRNNQRNIASQERINAANIALARELNDWNLEMWNRQNEYNNYSSIMGRMREAGMNPLFYNVDGTSNAGAITSADLANQTAFTGQEAYLPDVSQLNQGLLSIYNNTLNQEKINLERQRVKNETSKTYWSNEESKQNIKVMLSTYNLNTALAEKCYTDQKLVEQNIENAKATYDNIKSDTAKKKVEKLLIEQQTKASKEMTEAQIKLIENKCKLNEAQRTLIYKAIEKMNQEITNLTKDAVIKDALITGLDYDNLMKELETVFKEANLTAEWQKVQSEIFSNLNGSTFTFINSFARTLSGLATIDYNSSQLSGDYSKIREKDFNYNPKGSNSIPSYSDYSKGKGVSWINP